MKLISNSRQHRVVVYALAALWTLGLIVALALPGDSMPRIDKRFPWPLPAGIDKGVHALLFFGETLLLAWAFGLARSFEQALKWSLVAAALLAIGTEILQIWIPARSHDWKDLVANFAGVAMGLATYWLWRRSRRAESP